jgi:uncharacterized membrane protein YcfT
MLLGGLVLAERWWTVPEWLGRIGRHTLFIYIAHTIVLYGGIFGVGLKDWIHHSLNPWQAALGALGFCAAFGLAVQGGDWLRLRWRTRRLPSPAS